VGIGNAVLVANDDTNVEYDCQNVLQVSIPIMMLVWLAQSLEVKVVEIDKVYF
jgi:hypothetical protein